MWIGKSFSRTVDIFCLYLPEQSKQSRNPAEVRSRWRAVASLKKSNMIQGITSITRRRCKWSVRRKSEERNTESCAPITYATSAYCSGGRTLLNLRCLENVQMYNEEKV